MMRHWFKYAPATDLQHIRIYNFVRDTLAERFRFELLLLHSGAKLKKPLIKLLAYEKARTGVLKVWG